MGRTDKGFTLSEEQKAFFHANGYVHIEDVMSEEDMKTHIEPWFNAFLKRELLPEGRDLCDASGVHPQQNPDEFTVYNVLLPRKYNPKQQGNLFEQRCKDIADQLHSGGMAIDYDQILAKRPGSKDSIFAWHQDMAYWPPFTSSTATATCWLAVTDSTVENGCMRFVQGSNKETKLRLHFPVAGSREESHALCTHVDKEKERVVHVPVKRGSITVHNENVVHGSGPNKSDGWRNAYILAFRKEECIREERAHGFTHSHNDTHSWDAFNKWTKPDQ